MNQPLNKSVKSEQAVRNEVLTEVNRKLEERRVFDVILTEWWMDAALRLHGRAWADRRDKTLVTGWNDGERITTSSITGISQEKIATTKSGTRYKLA